MTSFHEDMVEYKKQLKKGVMNRAYKDLMHYIMNLRTHFMNKYPDFYVSGSIYYGYMDMTYFSFSPPSLKDRQLKIAIVFIHDACQFEVWLAGANKQVQSKYWEIFKKNRWDKYYLVPTTKDVDSIMEFIVDDNPDFRDLDGLTKKIEEGVLRFTKDVETFLSNHTTSF